MTNIPALLEGIIVTDKKENRHEVGVAKFRDPGYESTTGNDAHLLESGSTVKSIIEQETKNTVFRNRTCEGCTFRRIRCCARHGWYTTGI